MPDRFSTTGIPLTDVFSWRKERPCRFEHPSQPKALTACPPMCPYRRECDSTAGRLPLSLAYGRAIRVTLTEESSSIVVRSEHLYNKDERHRLCLRKHIYELDGPPEKRFKMTSAVILAVEDHIKDHIESGERRLPEDTSRKVVEILNRFVTGGDGYTDPDPVLESLSTGLSNLGIDILGCEAIKRIVRQHATAVLACHPIGEKEILSRYIGFVDIRTHSMLAPLAMGLLVPPRDLRHDPAVTIVSGEYGRIFGAHGFASTVFSMHDPGAGGAHCAQACIIMTLAAVADRGTKVLGSYDVTYLGKDPVQWDAPKNNCIANQPGCSSAFHIDGLRLHEIVKVLQCPECNASVVGMSVPSSWTSYRMCSRLIEAYVSARYPVIMAVDTGKWYGYDTEVSIGHSVVIVGIRRSSQEEHAPKLQRQSELSVSPAMNEKTQLIVHDPGYQPFLKRPFNECVKAAGAFAKQGRVQLVFTADAKIRLHAYHCLI